VVGSLLRPAKLKAAVEAFYEAGHSAILSEERTKDRSELAELEDDAIREAVRRQVELGLDVVTDGEFRRWMFLNSFYDAVEGFRTDNVIHFRNARGEDVPLAVHEIVDRLKPVDSPAAREATFMASASEGHPFKVTFPAASIFGHPFSYKAGITSGYGSLDEFVSHAIEIEQGLVADAIGAGARYIQFDLHLGLQREGATRLVPGRGGGQGEAGGCRRSVRHLSCRQEHPTPARVRGDVRGELRRVRVRQRAHRWAVRQGVPGDPGLPGRA
jgi:methionine synthase II (cobalamin-independent)